MKHLDIKKKRAEYMRMWRKRNPKRNSEIYMKWWRANKESSNLYKAACKMRKKADVYISKILLEEILNDNKRKYGRLTCELCKKQINKSDSIPEKASFDHKIPIRLGGDNSKENIQVVHHLCNNIKGNRLLEVL